MSEPQFDPYYAWLGIPPQQKKHFYSLLGLQLWEGNRDVVDACAGRQTAHLQSFKNGPHGELAQRLLNEVAQARLTLLTPDKKAAYDAKLRPILESAANGPGSSLQSAAGPALRPAKPTPVAPVKPTQVVAAVPVAPVAPVAGGASLPMAAPMPIGTPIPAGSPFGGAPQPAGAVPVQGVPARAMPVAAQAPAPAGDADLGLPSLPSFGAPTPAAASLPGDEFGLSAASAAVGLPTLAPPPPPPKEDRGGVPMWVVLVGGFLLIAAPIVGGAVWWNSLPKTGLLVLEIPAEGRNEVVVTVDEKPVALPASGTLEMPLYPGLHRFTASRPGYNDQGGQWKVEIGQRHAPMGPWQPQQAVLLELGGAEVADVQLEVDGRGVPLAGLPTVEGALQAPLPAGRRKLRLLRTGHEPFELEFDLSGGQMRKVVPLWTTKRGPAMDVLAKVDPVADALQSKWTRSPVGISCDKDENPALALPVKVEGSYDLQVDFTRSVGGNAVIVGLPVGSKACRLVLSGWMGEAAGLEDVDGRGARRNPTTVEPSKFANDERQKVEASVRVAGENARIYVRLNGNELIDWSGPIASLSAPDPKRESRPPTPDGRPSLHAWSSVVTFHKVDLRPADDGTAVFTEGGAGATPPMVDHTPALLAKLPPAGKTEALRKSQLLGCLNAGYEFDLLPSTPSLVVGFEYTTTLTNGEGKPWVCLNTFQPLFRDAQERRLGFAKVGKIDDDDGGTEMQSPKRIEAKEGYALGGFESIDGARIWGLKAIFCRVVENGLDPADQYMETVFEGPQTAAPRTLLTDGRPVVGIHGRAGSEVSALGLTLASLDGAVPQPLAASPFPTPPSTGPVDVLAMVDLVTDRVGDPEWRREGTDLVSGPGQNQTLEVRIDLPEEFDVHLALQRVGGLPKGFSLIARSGGRAAQVNLDGKEGSGFDIGQHYSNNKTSNRARFLTEDGRVYNVVYSVRRDGATLTVDGNPAVSYQGDFADMNPHPGMGRGMRLASNEASLRISKWEVVPPGGGPTPGTPGAPSSEPLVKSPVPDKELLIAAAKKIRQEFKKNFDAVGAGGDPSLAAALLVKARKLDLPPEERYAALEEALAMSSAEGAGLIAGLALDEMQKQFEVEIWPLRVKTITESIRRVKNAGDLWDCLDEVGKLRKVVAAPAQLAETAVLMLAIEQSAKKVGIADAAKRLQDDRKQLDLFKPLCASAEKAVEFLASTPDDPGASQALGLWKCLVQEDWAAGLPLLEKSGDRKLAPVAGALAKNPKDPAAQLAFADALWDWRPAVGQAYPPSAVRGAARDWYLKGGPDEAQLTKIQRQFAPDPVPATSSAPRNWPVPLLGLGGWRVMTPEEVEGQASPSKTVGAWMSSDQKIDISYPRLPVDTYVHEFELKMLVKDGWVNITYGDDREDRTIFRLYWSDSSKDFICSLYRNRIGFAEESTEILRYPANKDLKFTFYATPEKHFLFEGGQLVCTCTSPPNDLKLNFYASKDAKVEVGKFQFRPWTVRDSATVKRKWAGLETAAESEKRSLDLAVELLGVSEKAAQAAKAPFVCGTLRAPMQWIEPGKFTRIYPPKFELPDCEVSLTKGFWLGRYEVTQADWIAVAGANPSRTVGSRNLPVDGVSWTDAMRFCERLTQLERAKIPPGYEYRLPTDAEWEYACRAGTKTDFAVDPKDFWHVGNGKARMKQVGLSKPNSWGLFDMHGNASEWCLDRNLLPNGKPTKLENPFTPPTSPDHDRRVRGGSVYRTTFACSPRDWFSEADLPATGRGFRLCLGPTIK